MTNILLNIDAATVDWSRAQFALTAIYHWLFVPLTLGLALIMGIMETCYYRTRKPFWRDTAKFWQKLFGINFAMGVATGIILEFEFGTNWSNYSWFVGDIFGAPLAIEGIVAFFMESTFVAVMFFGWKKVSAGFHLAATWLRNDPEWKDRVVYWGPMGCCTGCYLILQGALEPADIVPMMRRMWKFIADFEGEIPGATARDCGNFSFNDLPSAKSTAYVFLSEVIDRISPANMVYPE